jgi:hypothetical protein
MPIILFISTNVFSNGLFTTDAMAAFRQCVHLHTLFLCRSASLLSSPLSLFDIKTLATISSLSIEY